MRYKDADYWAGLHKAKVAYEFFRRQYVGRKIHRAELGEFIDGHNKNKGDNIYDMARKLLAEAPRVWPDGASLSDGVETYAYRRGLPKGMLSMYGTIAELVKWRVRENKHGLPNLELVRWERPEVTARRFALLKASKGPTVLLQTGQKDAAVQIQASGPGASKGPTVLLQTGQKDAAVQIQASGPGHCPSERMMDTYSFEAIA